MDSKKKIFGQKHLSEICHRHRADSYYNISPPQCTWALPAHWPVGADPVQCPGPPFSSGKGQTIFLHTHRQRTKPIRSRGIYKSLYTARHSDRAKPTTCMSYTFCSFKLRDGIQAASTFSPRVAWALPTKDNRINAVCCIKNCIE